MVTLDYEQLRAVQALGNGKILCGAVGTGKSRTALAYYVMVECDGNFPLNGRGKFSPMKKPKDLYIITTARKRDSLDWESECLSYMLGNDENAYFGVKIAVDSWNNIKKYAEIKNAFFIFDEQRLVGSGEWVKSFTKIARSNRWILLSATPGDTWSDYIPVFIANGFYKNRSEFMTAHAVYSRWTKYPKVDRYVEENVLERYKKSLLVPIHFQRHTVRHVKMIGCSYDRDKFDMVLKKRWNVFENRPIKDVSELHYAMRRVVNSDEARGTRVAEIMEDHPKVIIFYNFNYELDMLRQMLDELGVNFSEWNGHKHEPVPTGERWAYLVQYTAGAEAWNCITTDTIVFYSLNYSYRVLDQAQGRIDRRNTPYVDLYYYILRSNSQIDLAIWKALSKKKDFNERSFNWKDPDEKQAA